MEYREADPFESARASLARNIAWRTEGSEQFASAIANLTFYRRERATQPCACLVEPSVAIVVQGAKRMLLETEAYAYDPHHFLITSLDLPANMQVVDASDDKPYLGLVLKLDSHMMADLMGQCTLPVKEPAAGRGMVLGHMTVPLLEAFNRLVCLLDDPNAIPILAPLIQREIFYRLLMSEQGARLRQVASVGSQSHRIARAIDWLKARFAEPLSVDDLAARAQMSTSSFHHHFRQLTAMSPLQYQKWLRLNEARRLMLTEHLDASSAAFEVGYESPSQFSREYSRTFGAPPRRDIEMLRRPAGPDAAQAQATAESLT
jgi:AraC-like DNA-binding protein